jgi:hypothetical protein
LSVDARYYICGEREYDWTLAPGSYTGMFIASPSTTLTISQVAIDSLIKGGHLTTLKINPSFFQVAAGIKIKL